MNEDTGSIDWHAVAEYMLKRGFDRSSTAIRSHRASRARERGARVRRAPTDRTPARTTATLPPRPPPQTTRRWRHPRRSQRSEKLDAAQRDGPARGG